MPVAPKIRSLPLPPSDLVTGSLLADDEVVGGRSAEVDATGVAVVRIEAADEVVIGPELVAVDNGAVEVDALDAGLGIRAVEVVHNRDGLSDRVAPLGRL